MALIPKITKGMVMGSAFTIVLLGVGFRIPMVRNLITGEGETGGLQGFINRFTGS